MNDSRFGMLRRVVLVFLFFLLGCAGKKIAPYEFPTDVMSKPPGGLAVDQVPMFISFGSDDNPYADGLRYLTDLFNSKNLHYSFYVNTINITPQGEDDPEAVKASWREAIESGNEIGVHTHSHPHGKDFSVKQWQKEMALCSEWLTKPTGLGQPAANLLGFRTPFLEYADHTLTAVQREKFAYDCSIEEGLEANQDGRNFVWPYTLDHGAPGDPEIREHAGLWELPVYAFIAPPDELCEAYGVPPGLRARLLQRSPESEMPQGKITGMDWNLWFQYGTTKAEFLAVLKYTLDQRLKGNRCPLTVGLHSWTYSEKSDEHPPGATLQERRDALREFVDYAISKPEVRVVTAKDLLAWMKSPTPLQAPETQLGAGFRYSVFNEHVAPVPVYWQKVATEMAKRFPGATPEGIWIVTGINGRGAKLSFPLNAPVDPLITGNDGSDPNEAALNLFDQLGFRIWLQVEPAFAPVDQLLDLTLQRYSHHPCVVGVGLDVEWNKSTNPDGGEQVTDDQARAWLALARKYHPQYRLFLKHWLPEKMPPTVREGILFVDDSQEFKTMDEMVSEFAQWGKTFAPHPVAFQFGYPADQPWWSKLNDPPKEIGNEILKQVPNTEALFWVDFSVLDVFGHQ